MRWSLIGSRCLVLKSCCSECGEISFVFIGASISSVMLNASSTALCSTPNQLSANFVSCSVFSLLNLFGREAFRVAGIAAIGFTSHAVSADSSLRVHLFQPCVAPCSCTRRCWARSHVVKRLMWCGLLANEVVAAPPNKICYQAARLSVVSWQVAQHCFAMWWQMQLKELQRTP